MDLSAQHPDKLKALMDVWFDEADRNLVLPLDDRTARDLLTIERPQAEPPRTRTVYYAGTSPVPEGVAASIRGRSYKIIADVEITDKASGVIFAHGSRFGGRKPVCSPDRAARQSSRRSSRMGRRPSEWGMCDIVLCFAIQVNEVDLGRGTEVYGRTPSDRSGT
jgi:hypothetical protein